MLQAGVGENAENPGLSWQFAALSLLELVVLRVWSLVVVNNLKTKVIYPQVGSTLMVRRFERKYLSSPATC
jgi:hypothetical protein